MTMDMARVLREVRLMRFEEVYDRRLGGRLTASEAADILGIDERTFRRWNRRYEENGACDRSRAKNHALDSSRLL